MPHALPASSPKADAPGTGRAATQGVATTLGGSQRRHRQRPERSALSQPLRVQNRLRQSPAPIPARWTVALALSPQRHRHLAAYRPATLRVPPSLPPTRAARRLSSRAPLWLVTS